MPIVSSYFIITAMGWPGLSTPRLNPQQRMNYFCPGIHRYPAPPFAELHSGQTNYCPKECCEPLKKSSHYWLGRCLSVNFVNAGPASQQKFSGFLSRVLLSRVTLDCAMAYGSTRLIAAWYMAFQIRKWLWSIHGFSDKYWLIKFGCVWFWTCCL